METMKLVSHSQATELSAVKRELLEKRLKGVLKPLGWSTSSAIPRRDPAGPVSLSHSQERLWFIQQMEPETSAYNLPCALRIIGEDHWANALSLTPNASPRQAA